MGNNGVESTVRELVRVTISKDSMTASILLRKPQSGQQEITVEDVHSALVENGVVFGINEDVITKAVSDREYNAPIKIAEGTRPVRGESSKIVYEFDTSDKRSPAEGADGRIDYHDISFIQSVSDGDLLAHKIPPTPGIPGKSILGKEIAGPDGRDILFKNGVNTLVSKDGLELRASASGAIVFLNGKVSVNDVLVIQGDVDFNVGNIDARGSVKISGTVKAGFELKVDGDIEIGGNMEDATVCSKGNILLKGGFFGNGQGVVMAEGDITLKYAEGQKIVSGGSVFVGGELINCQVTAKNVVHMKSRRGKIIGGETRAGKEIRTSVAGSDAGTKTNLHVAFDAALIKKHRTIEKELERLKVDKARTKEALYGLYKRQMNGKLPPYKAATLATLEQFVAQLPAGLEALQKQKAEIEAKLREYQDSTIVVEETLHSGVVVHFGTIYRVILEDAGACRISLEGNQIMLSAMMTD